VPSPKGVAEDDACTVLSWSTIRPVQNVLNRSIAAGASGEAHKSRIPTHRRRNVDRPTLRERPICGRVGDGHY